MRITNVPSIVFSENILEQAQPEHELGVFDRSAKVRGISVPYQLIDEQEIDHLVYPFDRLRESFLYRW